MKKYVFLLFVIFIAPIGSCDYYDNRLQVQNNSNEQITFEFSLDTVLDQGKNEDIKYLIRDGLSPGETKRQTRPGSTNAWPGFIEQSNNKKLNVFFINLDSLSKFNDWNYLREKKAFTRKEYSLEELERINWIIEYP